MNNFICKQCNKKFVGNSDCHIYKFCSSKCYGQSIKGKKPPTYKGRIKRSGYWYVFLPEHSNSGKQGYFAEHRLVMEKHLGRILNRSEVVHHKNGDITDNRIENLELFTTHGQHTLIAHPEIREKQKISFKGKHFSPKTEFKKGMTPWNKSK